MLQKFSFSPVIPSDRKLQESQNKVISFYSTSPPSSQEKKHKINPKEQVSPQDQGNKRYFCLFFVTLHSVPFLTMLREEKTLQVLYYNY